MSRNIACAAALAVAGIMLACGNAGAQQPTELKPELEQDRTTPSWMAPVPVDDGNAMDPVLRPTVYDPISAGAEADETAADEDPFSSGDVEADNAGNGTVSGRPLTTALERRAGSSPIAGRRTRDGEASDPGSAPAGIDAEILTGNVGARTIDDLEGAGLQRARRTNEPTDAMEARDALPEEDPFAPLGIRAGRFILYPELEQGMTWTSNADYSPDGNAAVLSETTLRLGGVSDWSRHAMEFQAYAALRKTVSGLEISDPTGGFNGKLRLDLADGFTATGEIGYELKRETASSAIVIPGVEAQPLLQRLGGEIGLSRETGKLRLAATAAIERLVYGDVDLTGGGTLSQADRNATIGTMKLRSGFALSPALVPFVEAEFGRRVFDEKVDAGGYARSANRYGLRAGVEFDFGEKLSGEIAAGWISEKPEDARLAAIEGLGAGAAIAWSPMRGTTVSINAETIVETTTDPGLSGSILYSATTGVERELRANLTANASLGLAWRDYYGSGGRDLIFDAEAGLTWWINRYFGVTGRTAYESVISNLAGRDTETASIFLGVRLRR